MPSYCLEKHQKNSDVAREVEGGDLIIPPFAKNAKDGAPVDC
jgi:hypothetical protein